MSRPPPRPDHADTATAAQDRDAARGLAIDLLVGVLNDGQMLDEQPFAQHSTPEQRARARRLVLACLRDLQRADAVLNPLLRKPPPPHLHALLRLSVVEILTLDAPAHAVVQAAVTTARAQQGGSAMAGLVNAVLRRAATTEAQTWAALPAGRLPGWLRRRLGAAYGKDAVAGIEAAHHAGAPLDLTLPPMPAAERDALTQALDTAAGPVQALPGGSLRLGAGVQVSALPGYAEGRWWVQDAAAALPATLLAAQVDEAVLDLCAAPGGKTMQLAATGAQVTALDRSARRLERLRANLARTGLVAETVCADALDWQPPAPVDAVLLDAPCTATGTIRRHPELPQIRKPAGLQALTDLQAQLIDTAAGFLRPGGRLVYCTCSLLPQEGEDQLAAALARNPGLTLAPHPPLPLGAPAAKGGWRTRPDDPALADGMDGFFMVLLQKA